MLGSAYRSGRTYLSSFGPQTAIAEQRAQRALGGREPGKEIEAPLALVVLGGLVTSTFLNMVVVPALYFRWGGAREGAA